MTNLDTRGRRRERERERGRDRETLCLVRDGEERHGKSLLRVEVIIAKESEFIFHPEKNWEE